MGHIRIVSKREQSPICASRLETLKTYRVVDIKIREDDLGAQGLTTGNILIALPNRGGPKVIFNCTHSTVLHNSSGLLDRVLCVRDFSIESIVLVADDNELPA